MPPHNALLAPASRGFDFRGEVVRPLDEEAVRFFPTLVEERHIRQRAARSARFVSSGADGVLALRRGQEAPVRAGAARNCLLDLASWPRLPHGPEVVIDSTHIPDDGFEFAHPHVAVRLEHSNAFPRAARQR